MADDKELPREYKVTLVTYPDGIEMREWVWMKAWSARDAYDQARIEYPSKAVRRVEPQPSA